MDCPLISIIVPIYNTEKYLSYCVDSILSQTYANFELFLVDDGSTDQSGCLCDRYGETDIRVKVYHKQNGGVSSARNLGLEHAKGQWITFIDSDDYVKEDYLKHLVCCAKENIDLVISYAIVDKNGTATVENYPSATFSGDHFDILFCQYDMHWHTSPWGKLYRRKLINQLNLTFPVGINIGEDIVFLFTYMSYCANVCVSGASDYCYFATRSLSLTHKIYSYESEWKGYNSISYCVNCLICFKYISNATALANLYWLIATYCERVLNSIYQNPSKWSVKERIHLITLLDLELCRRYSNHSSDLKVKLLRWLLLDMKFLRLYDSIRTIKREISVK